MTSVSGVIRDVLNDTELTDPDEVAREAFARIDADNHGDYLQELMRQVVVVEMSRVRMESRPSPGNRSSFVNSIQGYSRALRARVVIDGVWKMYGDCTHSDLGILAEQSRTRAAEHLAAAERHEKMRAALEEYDVATVSDLPESVIADTLGGGQ